MDLASPPTTTSGELTIDQTIPWPRNLYFHIKRREWRARYIYMGKKRMKNFSLKRYSCEIALILGAHFLREMRKRRVPTDFEIASWSSELNAVLPHFQCSTFEIVPKTRKTQDSQSSKSKSHSLDSSQSPNKSEVLMHYHMPFPSQNKDDAENSLFSSLVPTQTNIIPTTTAATKALQRKILDKIPSKFNETIQDINKLVCVASQSIPYVPIGGLFNPDPRRSSHYLPVKLPHTPSDLDNPYGMYLNNEFINEHNTPTNFQDDYFNVCHTLDQLSKEIPTDKYPNPEFKETTYYTYPTIESRLHGRPAVGKMPSIYHRLKCAVSNVSSLSNWHNLKITTEKLPRGIYTKDNREKIPDKLKLITVDNMSMDPNNASIINTAPVAKKRGRKKEDNAEAYYIKYLRYNEYCRLVSNCIKQLESNLDVISQLSKCPTLLDDPRMYIKQSINSAIPNFFNGEDHPEPPAKACKTESTTPDAPLTNYRIPISNIYSSNNSLYDYVNYSRFFPKSPVTLREPVIIDSDTSYATRLLKPHSVSSSPKSSSASYLNYLCSSGLLALINQAQFTTDPSQLALIILSAMTVNENQQDEPAFVDRDVNAKLHKVSYVNGIVVLDDEEKNLSAHVDKNQLLMQHQAQAIAKLKRALSFGTVGNKMTIRGQIGLKISTLMNDILKVSQHRNKLLVILDKIKHLDKRTLEMVAEGEKLHKALYYYRKSFEKNNNTFGKKEIPTNYLEELLNLEMLHFGCESIMETKIKLTQQIVNFYNRQCAILDRIIPDHLCKAIEIILASNDKVETAPSTAN